MKKYLRPFFSTRRLCIFAVIIFISISPEIPLDIILPGSLQFTIRLEDILLLFILFFWFVVSTKYEVKVPLFINTFVIYLTLSFLLVLLNYIFFELSILRSSFYWLKKLEFVFFGVIVANLIESERDLEFFIYSIFIGGCLNSIWAIYQVMTGEYGALLSIMTKGTAYGTSLIGQPAVLASAGYYLPSVFLSFSLFLQTKKVRYFAIFLLFFFSMSGSISRSVIGGCVISLVAIVLYRLIKKRFFSVKWGYILLTLPALILLSGYNSLLYKRFHLSAILRGVLIRMDQWSGLLTRSLPHSLIGYGTGNLGFAIGFKEAHNFYLRTFIINGVLGLMVFLLFIGYVFKTSIYVYKESNNSIYDSVALSSILTTLALMFTSLFQDVFINVKVSEMYWVLLGGLGGAYILIEQ